MSLADALDGCERILADEFKDLPESALHMIGAVDEATEKAKANANMKAKAADKTKPEPQAEAVPLPAKEAVHAADDA